jgi:hypothetical protein
VIVSGNQHLAPRGTPAERLRSLLGAALSLTLHTPGHRADLIGRHAVDGMGEIRVELPADSCLARRLRDQGELVAMIEVTDLAPVPMRNRVRCRGTFTGWLTQPVVVDRAGPLAQPGGFTQPGSLAQPGGLAQPDAADAADDERELAAVFSLAGAELSVAGEAVPVDPEDFAAVRPDPLAVFEAELLCHLMERHPGTVDHLSRLIPPHDLHGVRNVAPLRLDRYGIVLRLEFPRHDRDVRLDFGSPLDRPDELGGRIEALLARAGRCRHRSA